MSIIPQKHCSKCDTDKPITDFGVDRATKSGYTAHCKACRRANVKRWQLDNVEHRVIYGKQWRENNRQFDKVRKAQWYQGRADAERERARLWRANNPDKLRKQIRTYRAAHPEKIRIIMQRRRARRYQQGGCYTESQWVALKTHYQFTCLRCHRCEPEIRLTADHVVPIARGGSSYIENIQPLCDACNRWKNVRTVDFRL